MSDHKFGMSSVVLIHNDSTVGETLCIKHDHGCTLMSTTNNDN
jgi:hypothetical protein